jgi:hypothetical protein
MTLHFQNNQKNGVPYPLGKLDMPTPTMKMNLTTLTMKMNLTTLTMKMNMTTIKTMLKVENHYHPDNHHPETNQDTTQNYGSTILNCVQM